MRNHINVFAIIICLLQLACVQQKQQQANFDFKPPKIVEAKAYKVQPGKKAPPRVIAAGGVKKIAAGKPDIIPIKSNVFPAKNVSIIQATQNTTGNHY